MDSRRRRVSWSDIPSELLSLIAERLGTRFDTCNFRSVCKLWCAAASFSTHLPENHLSPILPFKLSIRECNFASPLEKFFDPLILVPNAIFLIRSTVNSKVEPWLCIVQESNPGKLRLRELGSQFDFKELPKNVPKNLNLSYFNVVELGRFYTVRRSVGRFDWHGVNFYGSKLVLIVDPNCRTFARIDDYMPILLTADGNLRVISIKNRRIEKIPGLKTKIYDDVVNYRGRVFAIDRKGRGYTMSYNETRLCNVVSHPVGEGSGSDRKKCLVESSNGELYLVHRCPPYFNRVFRIYKLNEERNCWDKVKGIGDDRILIVTSDRCFFAMTKHFPGLRGNCIVFRKRQFPVYNSSLFVTESDIFVNMPYSSNDEDIVFPFDGGDCTRLISYHGYYNLFRLPPRWLSTDTHLLNSNGSIKETEILKDFCCRVASEPISKVEISAAKTMLAIKDQNAAGQKLRSKDVLESGVCPRIIDIDTFPDLSSKGAENTVLQAKFRGVNVRSDVIPILEKIWDKYGDVIQNHVVQSDGLLRWALETLAKMVVLLQTNSAQSFSNSQAAFLSATIKDLMHLQFQLNWLLPFVEKLGFYHLDQ
ncbi:F-box protein SKIP23-like [Silene latifolia]|uniref:F-box protein SKIP23-like n=1 Tax=Silene latifolia TaxID=37657 RepID=UPI003D77B84D